jgi:ectonucleotide pyrophosphatase/phosphodiesterase family member 5
MKLFKVFLLAIIFFPVLICTQSKPYVILVSFDAFRWDYLNRDITPNLEKIRTTGVSALSLRPSFPSKTFPNHISIVTGMYPAHHGIIANNFEDPFSKTKYRMNDTNTVTDSRWYQGESVWETAERQGIKTASFFWPGAEVKLSYRHPTYFEKYNHKLPYETRITGVINWLQLPIEKRPHFITLYMHETDEAGHTFGPNSEECNKAIKLMDEMAGLLLKKLDDIKMRDSVDVIFLSDHGMTEVSKERTVNIESLISETGCRINDEGVLMAIDVPKEKLHEVYELLKKNENHFKVYYRESIPAYFHFSDNPLIAPIIVIPELGWNIITNKSLKWIDSQKGGNHGYDNNQTDMHGIFLATGPNFKKGYHTGTIWNIDIYPLICKIFGIIPRANIDGDINRIEFILN